MLLFSFGRVFKLLLQNSSTLGGGGGYIYHKCPCTIQRNSTSVQISIYCWASSLRRCYLWVLLTTDYRNPISPCLKHRHFRWLGILNKEVFRIELVRIAQRLCPCYCCVFLLCIWVPPCMCVYVGPKSTLNIVSEDTTTFFFFYTISHFSAGVCWLGYAGSSMSPMICLSAPLQHCEYKCALSCLTFKILSLLLMKRDGINRFCLTGSVQASAYLRYFKE